MKPILIKKLPQRKETTVTTTKTAGGCTVAVNPLEEWQLNGYNQCIDELQVVELDEEKLAQLLCDELFEQEPLFGGYFNHNEFKSEEVAKAIISNLHNLTKDEK